MITSTANTHIKDIRKLKDRKYRNETGLFFLEGIRIVIEALRMPDLIKELILAPDLLDNKKALEEVEKARKKGVSILEVSKDVFNSFSSKDGPQGLAAIGNQHWLQKDQLIKINTGIWIVLFQVADPGNLGTIIRTMDGMGGKGIILLDHCTDPYDPSAIRASMGGLFSKLLVKMTSIDFIELIKQNQIYVVGTSDAAKLDYRNCKYKKDMLLLMGSEREGLPLELTDICNSMVSLPMVGCADSLNLAVASSITLYEIASQLKLFERKEHL